MGKFRISKITVQSFLVIAVPLALQGAVTAILSLVDTIMVGSLGDAAIATMSLSSRFFLIFCQIIAGLGCGATIFMTQFWGKHDVTNVKRISGLNMVWSVGTGLVFGLFAFLFPRSIIKVFSADAAVVEAGAQYIKIVALSYPLLAASWATTFFLRSVGQVKIPVVSSTLPILLNTLFNYLFIFGKFGFPQLGVLGVAYSTLLVRVSECTLIHVLAMLRLPFVRQNIRDYITFPKELIKKFWKTTYVVLISEVMWVIGVSVYPIVYSRTGSTPAEGTMAVAAVNVTALLEQLANVFINGMAVGVCIVIGREIGSRRYKRALYNASRYALFAPLIGVVTGIVIVLVAPFYLKLFNLSSQAAGYVRALALVTAFSIPLKNFNIISVNGIFKGGGDMRHICFMNILAVWCAGVPLAFIAGLILKLPIEFVFAGALCEEVVKTCFSIIRLKNRKWLHDLVN